MEGRLPLQKKTGCSRTSRWPGAHRKHGHANRAMLGRGGSPCCWTAREQGPPRAQERGLSRGVAETRLDVVCSDAGAPPLEVKPSTARSARPRSAPSQGPKRSSLTGGSRVAPGVGPTRGPWHRQELQRRYLTDELRHARLHLQPQSFDCYTLTPSRGWRQDNRVAPAPPGHPATYSTWA